MNIDYSNITSDGDEGLRRSITHIMFGPTVSRPVVFSRGLPTDMSIIDY